MSLNAGTAHLNIWIVPIPMKPMAKKVYVMTNISGIAIPAIDINVAIKPLMIRSPLHIVIANAMGNAKHATKYNT